MVSVDSILVARDFSPVSRRVIRMGLGLAAKMRATLHLLHVYRDRKKAHPTHGLDAIRQELAESGFSSEQSLEDVPVLAAERQGTTVAPTILQYAEEEDVDLIGLGTHGRRGMKRVFTGSVAETVVRCANRAVLTVRGEAEDETAAPGSIDRILAPVDFSERATESTRVAMEWAELYDAQTDLLHVVDADQYLPSAEVRSRLVEFAKDRCRFDVPTNLHVERGPVGDVIADFANARGTGLVVMATRGRTGFRRSVLGSITETVVRNAISPVLAVHPSGKSIRATTIS